MTDPGSGGSLNWVWRAGFKAFMTLVELNVVPDILVRTGIKYLLYQRVKKVIPDPALAAGH